MKTAPGAVTTWGSRPETGLHGLGQEIVRRRQQVKVVGVVHAQFAVAHHHQQSLAVVAHGDVDGAKFL